MQALQILKPEQSAVVNVHEPTCGKEEVLLRVVRAGLCGSDLNSFRGANPLVTYPRIPGHEIAAEILRVGSSVPETLKPGELATVFPYSECGTCSACVSGRPNCCQNNQTLGVQRDGALAELIAIPWQNVIKAHPLHASELALIEPLAVGHHAVQRGRVSPEDTVCVVGCGMIGLGVISAAALIKQARVIAVDIADSKLALAESAGAAFTINSAKQDLSTALRELTEGQGPGVMIEAVGLPTTFRMCVDEAQFAGRVVYVGYAKDLVQYDTKTFLLKELDIMGSRNATRSDFEQVAEMLKSGRYPTAETITSCVPLEDAPAALTNWADSPQSVTKIHIDFNEAK